tara:strand:- start:1159 stop:1524 length:366 start_codon:yes stop_codon:yes gene_type:complete
MIEDKVMKKLKGKNWTFSEISQVNVLIDTIKEDMYNDLDAKEKLDLVWDKVVDAEGKTFGEFFKANVDYVLKEQIAIIIKAKLDGAKINFNEDDKNEISKRSLGGEPHKGRSPNETSDSKE